MSSTIINNLKNIQNYSYLELGVGNGINFNSILCRKKTSVDIIPGVATFTGTTDEYFDQLEPNIKFDIVYIDANHTYEYVTRDFNNVLHHTNHWILIHDMIPAIESDSSPLFCGDSYKLLHHMALNWEFFEAYPMDENFGLTLVRMPAREIKLSDESKNLSYTDFMNFMADKKLYSRKEIIEILQHS